VRSLTYYSSDLLSLSQIFTRNAFGSFRDIVKEVAYSPMMGEFLTFMNNRAYASSGTYPDENFAREVMQLFTLGLDKLNRDGSPILDASGAPIPAYDNDGAWARGAETSLDSYNLRFRPSNPTTRYHDVRKDLDRLLSLGQHAREPGARWIGGRRSDDYQERLA
jgi:hypothetical protein